MLVDSHCHLNCLDLSEFNQNLEDVLKNAKQHDVSHLLSVCVELEDYPQLEQIADRYSNVSISVGVHPNTEMEEVLKAELLCKLAAHPSCIAIGETGLDYYRTKTEEAQEVQRARFREHIKAALITSKPLIIHTREAAEDTLKVLAQENAQDIGGVMHCFSENIDIARRAIDLNFYISFSGIVTFKNATMLQEVARQVPLDRVLIETDAPYLAPVPFRGKQNQPAYVKYVCEAIAALRGLSYEEVAQITTKNFHSCFRLS